MNEYCSTGGGGGVSIVGRDIGTNSLRIHLDASNCNIHLSNVAAAFVVFAPLSVNVSMNGITIRVEDLTCTDTRGESNSGGYCVRIDGVPFAPLLSASFLRVRWAIAATDSSRHASLIYLEESRAALIDASARPPQEWFARGLEIRDCSLTVEGYDDAANQRELTLLLTGGIAELGVTVQMYGCNLTVTAKDGGSIPAHVYLVRFAGVSSHLSRSVVVDGCRLQVVGFSTDSSGPANTNVGALMFQRRINTRLSEGASVSVSRSAMLVDVSEMKHPVMMASTYFANIAPRWTEGTPTVSVQDVVVDCSQKITDSLSVMFIFFANTMPTPPDTLLLRVENCSVTGAEMSSAKAALRVFGLLFAGLADNAVLGSIALRGITVSAATSTDARALEVRIFRVRDPPSGIGARRPSATSIVVERCGVTLVPSVAANFFAADSIEVIFFEAPHSVIFVSGTVSLSDNFVQQRVAVVRDTLQNRLVATGKVFIFLVFVLDSWTTSATDGFPMAILRGKSTRFARNSMHLSHLTVLATEVTAGIAAFGGGVQVGVADDADMIGFIDNSVRLNCSGSASLASIFVMRCLGVYSSDRSATLTAAIIRALPAGTGSLEVNGSVLELFLSPPDAAADADRYQRAVTNCAIVAQSSAATAAFVSVARITGSSSAVQGAYTSRIRVCGLTLRISVTSVSTTCGARLGTITILQLPPSLIHVRGTIDVADVRAELLQLDTSRSGASSLRFSAISGTTVAFPNDAGYSNAPWARQMTVRNVSLIGQRWLSSSSSIRIDAVFFSVAVGVGFGASTTPPRALVVEGFVVQGPLELITSSSSGIGGISAHHILAVRADSPLRADAILVSDVHFRGIVSTFIGAAASASEVFTGILNFTGDVGPFVQLRVENTSFDCRCSTVAVGSSAIFGGAASFGDSIRGLTVTSSAAAASLLVVNSAYTVRFAGFRHVEFSVLRLPPLPATVVNVHALRIDNVSVNASNVNSEAALTPSAADALLAALSPLSTARFALLSIQHLQPQQNLAGSSVVVSGCHARVALAAAAAGDSSVAALIHVSRADFLAARLACRRSTITLRAFFSGDAANASSHLLGAVFLRPVQFMAGAGTAVEVSQTRVEIAQAFVESSSSQIAVLSVLGAASSPPSAALSLVSVIDCDITAPATDVFVARRSPLLVAVFVHHSGEISFSGVDIVRCTVSLVSADVGESSTSIAIALLAENAAFLTSVFLRVRSCSLRVARLLRPQRLGGSAIGILLQMFPFSSSLPSGSSVQAPLVQIDRCVLDVANMTAGAGVTRMGLALMQGCSPGSQQTCSVGVFNISNCRAVIQNCTSAGDTAMAFYAFSSERLPGAPQEMRSLAIGTPSSDSDGMLRVDDSELVVLDSAAYRVAVVRLPSSLAPRLDVHSRGSEVIAVARVNVSVDVRAGALPLVSVAGIVTGRGVAFADPARSLVGGYVVRDSSFVLRSRASACTPTTTTTNATLSLIEVIEESNISAATALTAARAIGCSALESATIASNTARVEVQACSPAPLPRADAALLRTSTVGSGELLLRNNTVSVSGRISDDSRAVAVLHPPSSSPLRGIAQCQTPGSVAIHANNISNSNSNSRGTAPSAAVVTTAAHASVNSVAFRITNNSIVVASNSARAVLLLHAANGTMSSDPPSFFIDGNSWSASRFSLAATDELATPASNCFANSTIVLGCRNAWSARVNTQARRELPLAHFLVAPGCPPISRTGTATPTDSASVSDDDGGASGSRTVTDGASASFTQSHSAYDHFASQTLPPSATVSLSGSEPTGGTTAAARGGFGSLSLTDRTATRTALPPPVPRVGLPVAQSTATALAVLSALASSGGYLAAFRARRVAGLSNCLADTEDAAIDDAARAAAGDKPGADGQTRLFRRGAALDDLGPDNNPLGLSLESDGRDPIDSKLASYAGAALGNIVLLVAVLAALLATAALLRWRGKHRSMDRACAAVRFPGLVADLYNVVGPNSAAVAAALVAAGDFTEHPRSAALVVLVGLVYGVLPLWITFRIFMDTFWEPARHERLAPIKKADASQPKRPNVLFRGVAWLMEPSHFDWVETRYVQKFGGFFATYNHISVFWFADYGVATVIGCVTAFTVSCEHQSCCVATASACLAIAAIHFVLVVTLRPFLSRFDRVINIVAAAVTLAMTVLQVAQISGTDSGTAEQMLADFAVVDAALNGLLVFIFVISFLSACLNGLKTVLGFVKRRSLLRTPAARTSASGKRRSGRHHHSRHHQHQHQRRRKNATGSNRDDEDDDDDQNANGDGGGAFGESMYHLLVPSDQDDDNDDRNNNDGGGHRQEEEEGEEGVEEPPLLRDEEMRSRPLLARPQRDDVANTPAQQQSQQQPSPLASRWGRLFDAVPDRLVVSPSAYSTPDNRSESDNGDAAAGAEASEEFVQDLTAEEMQRLLGVVRE